MIRYKLVIAILTLGLFWSAHTILAGTISSTYKFAWSNNVGYINFENVVVNNDTLSGSAWSANNGWIKFDPAQGGVLNDGQGNLSGSAWGESLGWIDFDGVSVNASTGKFSGTATGALIGSLTFDCPNYCDVRTDWRQTTSGSSSGSVSFSNTTKAPSLPPVTLITPKIQQPNIPQPTNLKNTNVDKPTNRQNPSLPSSNKSLSNNMEQKVGPQKSVTFLKSTKNYISKGITNLFTSVVSNVENVFTNFINRLKWFFGKN